MSYEHMKDAISRLEREMAQWVATHNVADDQAAPPPSPPIDWHS